jgi:hypothetical protein
VIVLHELPGLITECLELGLILSERVPAQVHLPLLFGEPEPKKLGQAVDTPILISGTRPTRLSGARHQRSNRLAAMSVPTIM